MIEIGKFENKTISFDLQYLVESRLLIQANSGGGKSFAIRRLIEQCYGQIQIIVLDLEGEFSTLREIYDFIIAGKNADIPAHPSSAKLLARSLLELRVSAICDLYELPKHDRIRFVRIFLESLMSAPRNLWRPTLIILDEAHHFCPEKGQAESAAAVIDLATRGRKRGFCLVAATQRLAKLHKDVTAETLNKMIGRTGQDIDQARAADELGIIGKQDRIKLRLLKPGEFYIYGPALRSGKNVETGVSKVTVGPVKSHHPKVGSRVLQAPPKPTRAIKKILGELTDLPEAAKKEADDIITLKKDNADLRRKITIAEKTGGMKPCNHENVINGLGKEIELQKQIIEEFKGQNNQLKIIADNVKEALPVIGNDIINLSNMVSHARAGINDIKLPNKSFAVKLPKNIFKPGPISQQSSKPVIANNNGNKEVRGGAHRMLAVLAARHLMKTTKAQLATLSNLKKSSGTFGTYQSALVSNELISINSGDYAITQAGFDFLGVSHVEPKTPDEIQRMWRDKLSGGAVRMFDYLIEVYPQEISREALADIASLKYGTGTWGTYLSALRSNDLITENGNMLKANEMLF